MCVRGRPDGILLLSCIDCGRLYVCTPAFLAAAQLPNPVSLGNVPYKNSLPLLAVPLIVADVGARLAFSFSKPFVLLARKDVGASL